MPQSNHISIKALRLRNNASVDRLAALFSEGWHVLELDFPDLRPFVLHVPEEGDDVAVGGQVEWPPPERAFSIVLLVQENRQRKCRAVYVPESDSTSSPYVSDSADQRLLMTVSLEEGGAVRIFERMP